MKNLLNLGVFTALLLALFASALTAAEFDKDVWSEDYAKSMARAKAENKPMLVLFTGSTWCPGCIQLEKQVLSKKDFKDFARENLVCVVIDTKRNMFGDLEIANAAFRMQNLGLMSEYEIQGFPTIYIVKPDGKKIPVMEDRYDRYLNTIKELSKVAAKTK